jgi:outer membrane protein assembly factor BamD
VAIPSRVLSLALAAAIAAALAACGQQFKLANFKTSQSLYSAAMREYQRHHWDNAVLAFERLTLDLPARDTLLPTAYFYLGKAHQEKDEFLLAAQSFSRLAESFPDDTLADDALYEAGRSYGKLWRNPSLDATQGHAAMAEFRSMVELYPDSKLKPEADQQIKRLEEWFATKDYETGMHYFRRHAFDSAIIYFRDVVKDHPETDKAREAQLRLVESYRAIHYREDANEVCTALQKSFPNDREVREACGTAPLPQNAQGPPKPAPAA